MVSGELKENKRSTKDKDRELEKIKQEAEAQIDDAKK
jgi:hypothetical protein